MRLCLCIFFSTKGRAATGAYEMVTKMHNKSFSKTMNIKLIILKCLARRESYLFASETLVGHRLTATVRIVQRRSRLGMEQAQRKWRREERGKEKREKRREKWNKRR